MFMLNEIAWLTLCVQRHEAERSPGHGCQGGGAQRLPIRHEQAVDAGCQEVESSGKEKEKGVCGAHRPGRLVSPQGGHGESCPRSHPH